MYLAMIHGLDHRNGFIKFEFNDKLLHTKNSSEQKLSAVNQYIVKYVL